MVYTYQKIYSGNQVMMVRDVVRMFTGEKRTVCGIMIAKVEGKNSLGRPRLVWENNIKLDIKQTGWKGVVWSHRGQDSGRCWDFVNTVMELPVP